MAKLYASLNSDNGPRETKKTGNEFIRVQLNIKNRCQAVITYSENELHVQDAWYKTIKKIQLK